MDADDSNDERLRRRANWSRHWAGGDRHSCAGSFGDDYGGAIAAFWRETFTTMASGSRVLDIATGNGALPRLLAHARPAGDWQCDAVDLAQVAPTGWPAGGAAVRFHAGVAAEQLPFDDGSFPLIVSQYGLEYSHLPTSMPELLRVLAPGGRVALVVHHAESRPVTLAAVEIDHIDWLLSPDGLVGAAHPMLEPLSRAASAEGRATLAGDRRAEAIREHFNAASDTLNARGRAADGADVLFETQGQVAQVIQTVMTSGLDAARVELSALATALADARWRLDDLRKHALTDPGIEALASALSAAAGTVESGALRERGYLMGWSIRAGF